MVIGVLDSVSGREGESWAMRAKDEHRIKEQLTAELAEARLRIAELEESEAAHRKAEEELREAREYVQAIIHSSLDMIIAVDKNRKIIEFNEAAQRTFGYSREEILGKNAGILYRHPEDGLEIQESIREADQFTGEVTNKRKNGETFPSFLSASVLRDTKGRFIGFMGISRDITQQKWAEEKLRESTKSAKAIVEDLKDLLVATQAGGLGGTSGGSGSAT